MFPTLPDDLSTLSVAELRALRDQINAAAQAALRDGAGKLTAAEVSEITATAAGLRDKVLGEVARQAAASAFEGEAEGDVEPEVEEASDDSDADPGEDPADDDPVVDDEDDEEASAETPALTVRVPAARGRTGLKERPVAKRIEANAIQATDRAPSKRVGDRYESWTELAQDCIDFASRLSADPTEHFALGKVQGTFAEHMRMSDNPVDNLRLFDREEITAALCAPLPPVYDLACQNSTARPVKASLPNYAAPRGGVQIYPSPTLEDITTGYGLWTKDMDANPAATKDACATIKCATPSSYYIYGVYRCLTVQNMLAMTFPELVEAYLNRLAALQARKAETTLLEAMATDTTTITAATLGYNASVTITTTILNYLALYQEQQRWDADQMEAWMPRWVLWALKADLMRRKNVSGENINVPSDAQIVSMFTSAGFTPHFFRDTPTWATPIPKLQTSGVLGQFPRNLEILVAPRGKFALMDRGDLNIGVAGNVMRDNTSLSKNNFTFFFENFEGIVNTTSCPAHILHLNNLCYNGVQIQDVVINCEGGDQTGAAS